MGDSREKRRVGILGGMGPEATVLLMARIIAMTSAADDSDHVATIVDNNTLVPSRIKALIEKTGEDPGPVLADMARGLEANGARALAMPCNTAHHYAPVIEAAVGIPLLNMVELASARVAGMDLVKKRIGLLASPAVQTMKIFERAFSLYEIEIIYPADQTRMLDAIRRVKIDSNDSTARQIMENAARELMEQGADILLVACSELSIIVDAIQASIPRFDTIDILAEAVINFAGAELRNPEIGEPQTDT